MLRYIIAQRYVLHVVLYIECKILTDILILGFLLGGWCNVVIVLRVYKKVACSVNLSSVSSAVALGFTL